MAATTEEIFCVVAGSAGDASSCSENFVRYQPYSLPPNPPRRGHGSLHSAAVGTCARSRLITT